VTKSKPETKKLSVVFEADKAFASRLEQHLTALLDGAFNHCETLAEAAKEQENQVLVVLTAPVETLARHLKSASCTEAMAAWKAETKDFVQATRRLRRRLIMIDARALLQEGANLLKSLEFDLRTADSAVELPALPDAVHLIVAEALLAHDLEAAQLVGELEALCRGPQEALPLQEHFEEVRQTPRHLQAAQPEATISAEEVSLLRENIALQLSAAEEFQSQYAQLEADYTTLRKATADRHALKAETDTLKQRLANLQESSARREAVLDQIQLQDNTTLQAAYARADRLKTELSLAQAELDALRKELTAVYGSTSWQLTRPMRAMRNFTKGRRH